MRELILTNGVVTKLDDLDYEFISSIHWNIVGGKKDRIGYVFSFKYNVYLQQFILLTSAKVDHRNGDTLDNRRTNLRECTYSQNMANSAKRISSLSRYKGVSLHNKTGLWRARIVYKRKEHSLGYFTAQETAAAAYNIAAQRLFGEFARLNDVPQMITLKELL